MSSLTSGCVASLLDPGRLNVSVLIVCLTILFMSRLNGQQHNWRLKSTSVTDRALQYHPGQKIHGFTVKEVWVILNFRGNMMLCLNPRPDFCPAVCKRSPQCLLSHLQLVSVPGLSWKWSHVGLCCLIFRL